MSFALLLQDDDHKRNLELFDPLKKLNRKLMSWFKAQYFDYPDSNIIHHPYASPINASLKGLPPAAVINAAHDPLCDHAAIYARKLQESGIMSTNTTYLNSIHGFFNTNSNEAKEAMMEASILLRFAFDSHRHALKELDRDLTKLIERLKEERQDITMNTVGSLLLTKFGSLFHELPADVRDLVAISCGLELDQQNQPSEVVFQRLSDSDLPLHRFLSACYLYNRLEFAEVCRFYFEEKKCERSSNGVS